jgi:zinc finger-containing ubiquitin peptidase 1
MEHLPCPFCDFTDKDQYFLRQHVELIHPENGDSPFIVRDDDGPSRVYHSEDEEAARQETQRPPSRNSKENEYIECPYDCGERIPSAELPSHKDFHVAEGMALADAGLPLEVRLSTNASNDTPAADDISDHFTTDIPKSLRNLDQRGPDTPPRSYLKKRSPLKDLLLGSPGSPRRRGQTKSEPVTDGGTRRLGVSQGTPLEELCAC